MFPISLYLIEQVGLSPDCAISLILFGLVFLSFGGMGHLAFDTAINASNFLSLWAINGNSLITMVSLSLVSYQWELLDHDGFIVSRFLPDAITPCHYLQPGPFLRVISHCPSDSSASSAVFDLAAPMRLVRFSSSSLELGLSDPHSDVFVDDASFRLVQTDFSSFPDLGLDLFSRPENVSSSNSNSSRNGENRNHACHFQSAKKWGESWCFWKGES